MLCVVLQDTSLLLSFIADEYADVLIFWDMLCIHFVETSVRLQTAGVYMCVCTVR